eukprot:gene16791-20161_t
MPFQVIDNQRLYRQIADQLRALIDSGEFPPGSRLPAERELAKLLGVSRASVREAMIALEVIGLVDVRVGNGVLVCEPVQPTVSQEPVMAQATRDQWKEFDPELNLHVDFNAEIPPFSLLQARRLIEPEAAALAAKHATDEELAGIREAFERNVQDNRDGSHTHPGDRLFHIRIAQASGNPAYALMIAHLLGHRYGSMFQRLQAHYTSDDMPHRSEDEHRKILDALEQRDVEAPGRGGTNLYADCAMTLFYDARGNIYGVVSPAQLRSKGIDVPDRADLAAGTRGVWALAAIAADGNGLTIFAQSLTDQGLMAQGCELRVHHDKTDALSPVVTRVEPAEYEQVQGFWLALGRPEFGPLAVGAVGVGAVSLEGTEVSHVSPLAALNPEWNHSQFVRVGNPHCVTLVQDASALPDNAQLHRSAWFDPLRAIAFAPPAGAGQPCISGVNLQWVARDSGNRVIARVFERGEGPTASSGTSASAVACAAWSVGWVTAGQVAVVMPGGTAPVRLQAEPGELLSVSLFGTARLQEV